MTNLESIKSFLANVREQDNFEFTENGIVRFGAELSDMLLESVAAIRDDHKKERLRGVIKDVFELGDKDVVIFKQGEIFIKHFDQEATNQLQINKKVKDAIIALIEEKKYTEAEDTTTIPLNGISDSVGISISDLTPASKEDIKQKLKKQIGLADKDLVLFLNDKIIIKQVKQAEEPEVILKPTTKQKKRTAPVDRSEMSELRESIFESYERKKAHLM
jgi:DNA-binding MarR family transcriptional regulator